MPRKKGKKIVWKTVKVPKELHKVLKSKAQETNQPIHGLITSLIIASEDEDLASASVSLKGSAKNIDKAIWYCLKLTNGIGMHKQALRISNLIDAAEGDQIKQLVENSREKLMQTIDQIENRLKVDLSDVVEAIEEIEENGDGKTIAKLNETVKKAMFRIISQVVG